MAKETHLVLRLLAWSIRLYIIRWAFFSAYEIRLHAIKSYGLVIHEFDPWFNFRATQYVNNSFILISKLWLIEKIFSMMKK
jgi:asparagine N-glycosylation enzyme membrane subunit Stt3